MGRASDQRKKWLHFGIYLYHILDTEKKSQIFNDLEFVVGFTPELMKKQYFSEVTIWGYSAALAEVNPLGVQLIYE